MQLKPGVIRLIFLNALFLFLIYAHAGFAHAENNADIQTFTAGYYYSEGDYSFDEETRIQATLLSYKLKRFPWTWKASTSLLSIDGPGNITSGQEINPGSPTSNDDKDTGAGDIFVSTKYALKPWNNFRLYTDLGFKVKLPVADEDKGLGTGKTDIKTQLDFIRPFSSFTLLSYIAWKYRRDSDDFELNNTSHFSLGLYKRFKPFISAGLNYDFNENASGNNDHARELFTYISYTYDKHKKIDLYAITGLSDGSPDLAAGISLVYIYK